MPPLRALLHPAYSWRFLKSRLLNFYLKKNPNERGRILFPPGHFHSPLLDIAALSSENSALPHDGDETWENIPLHQSEQRLLFQELLEKHPPLPFPQSESRDYRYHYDNDWFPLSDAFTLSGLMRRENPRRIIEVGSGFSTAVMLDTLDHSGGITSITCLEPHPGRLKTLLRKEDFGRINLISSPVQEMPPAGFSDLDAGDFLFIDSSHVAKIGSDVTFLFLQVLPILKPGVWVHVHDIFYPETYPLEWIKQGRAWNESLILRAFLTGNQGYQIRAFNGYAGAVFPSSFWENLPAFRQNSGGSLWMQRCPN